ncbi:MAG: hypothetical protein EOP02_23230 [Proteobacteria bacterium]|nr:MAG: hypothetical protein EOP02_23230 [Pseudomonadota bacterium]
MAKRKLFEDIQRDPARFYRIPADVLRDRRFSDEERHVILKAWADADLSCDAQIAQALSELESRGVHHAAE